MNCHLADPTTVTALVCITCHGNPPNSSAYPNIAAVHGAHVAASKVATITLVCADCHNGLGLASVDHQVRAKARTASVQANPVVFSSNALVVAGGGTAPAFIGGANGQCSNTYCHGAKMPGGDTTGTNRAPTWGTTLLPATISVAACGICHGFPPSTASGHPSVTIPVGFPATPLGTTCSCHANINTQTATATTYANVFNVRANHINGTVEVSAGIAHAVPNYNHQAAGTGAACTSCHVIGTASSVYPAAVSGNAPDCRGCHKKGAPGTGCNSCHGDATTGRPNGTTFPDRVGYHDGSQDGAHGSAACSVCHNLAFPSGTGSGINHGPGNRNANPDAVGPFVNGITTTTTPGKGVTIPANSVTCVHGTINSGCSEGGTKTNRW
jgi:predicted CxxxxCH...CXXCH cytochrome family protein